MCDSSVASRYTNLKEQAKKSIEKQEWISALGILLKMQEISSNNYQLLNKLGYVYDQLGNCDAAKWYYIKASELKPNNDFSYFNLAILYMNRKQYNLSKKYFLHCFQIDDRKAVTHFWYAQLLLKININISKPLFHLIKAAEVKPRVANYHYCIGKTALELNTDENDIIAYKHLSTAIQLTNQNEIKYINEYVLHWSRWQQCIDWE
eukprot:555035_1